MMFVVAERVFAALIVNSVVTGIAFTFVLLRLWTRAVIKKRVGLDDVLMFGALAASIGFFVVFVIQMQRGLGTYITYEEFPSYLQAFWIAVPVYNLSLILCKLSIAAYCFKVFRMRAEQAFLRVVFIILCLFGLWTVVGPIFTCWPINAFWAANEGVQGTCMDRNIVAFSISGINILTDAIFVILPLPLIRGLLIPMRQKVILLVVLAIGLGVCAMSALRLVSLYSLSLAPPQEQSVQGVNLTIWSCVEINMAIMCATAPSLRPLVARIFPKLVLEDEYPPLRKPFVDMSPFAEIKPSSESRPVTMQSHINFSRPISKHGTPPTPGIDEFFFTAR